MCRHSDTRRYVLYVCFPYGAYQHYLLTKLLTLYIPEAQQLCMALVVTPS